MTIGQKVAKRYKAQYFDEKTKCWATFENWEIQPEQVYIVLRELQTEKAVAALVDKSWLHGARGTE